MALVLSNCATAVPIQPPAGPPEEECCPVWPVISICAYLTVPDGLFTPRAGDSRHPPLVLPASYDTGRACVDAVGAGRAAFEDVASDLTYMYRGSQVSPYLSR